MRKLSIIALTLCGIILASCANDDSKGNGGTKTAKRTEVTISLLGGGDTKSPTDNNATEAEKAVKTLELYVFNSDGSPDAEVGKVDEDPGKGYVAISNPGNSKKIIVGSGDNKKFIAAINMGIGELAENETYTLFKKRLNAYKFNTTAGHTPLTIAPTTGFEMSGEVTANIIEETTDNKVYIKVDRLVSKIKAPVMELTAGEHFSLSNEDITELWGDKASEITNAKLSFEFGGYTLVNGIDKSDIQFISRTSGKDNELNGEGIIFWDKWSTTGKAHLKSVFADNGNYTGSYLGKNGETGDNWFFTAAEATHSYVYENAPTKGVFNGMTGYDPNSVYALVIKGTIKVEGDATLNKERYWRLDLTDTETNFHIVRNCVYSMKITKINTIGENTPKEAEEKPGVLPLPGETAADVHITVNPWRLYSFDGQM